MSVTTERSQRTNRVVRHSALVLGLQVMLLGFALTNNFLLAHLGGPSGKGVIYLMQLIQGQGFIFFHFSLGYSAIYFLGRDRGYSQQDVASGMMLPSLVLSLIPLLLAVISWPLIRNSVTKDLAPAYLGLALLAIVPTVLTFNVSQFSLGLHRIGIYNMLGVGSAALLSIALLGLWVAGLTQIRFLAIAWFLSLLGPAIVALVLITRAAGGRLWPSRSLLQSSWRFGWKSHLGGITQQLQHRAPVWMVAFFLPVSQLGIYSLGVSLAELLWYMPNAVSTVLMPYVASGDGEDASRTTPSFCRIVLAATAILAVGLSVVSWLTIPRILPAFRGSLMPVFLLMPGVVIATVFRVLSSDFNGRGQPLKTFYPALIALVSEVLVGLIVIPRFGLIGAAVLTTAGYVLNSFLYALSYQKLARVRFSELLVLQPIDMRRIRSAVQHLFETAARNPEISVLTETPAAK